MPTHSFHEVARKVLSTATNVFATGLVLILGVILGRQMLEWWHVESRGSAPPDPLSVIGREPGLETGQGPWLEFGDSQAATRRLVVEGGHQEVLAALRGACKEIAEIALQVPGVTPAVESSHLTPWWERLRSHPPVERNAGKWLLYELPLSVPIVAVVREEQDEPREASGHSVGRHVLAWGMAFPSKGGDSADSWTAFVFSPTGSRDAESPSRIVTLPPGCRRLMAVAGTESSVIAFTSKLDSAALASQWDAVQADHWRAMGAWQTDEFASHRRYERATGETVDVQFVVESDGETLGYCYVTLKKK